MKRWCAIFLLTCALGWSADPALTTAQAALDAGDYAHALEQADSAAAAFHGRHDSANEAAALNIAGSAHLHRGEYDPALASYRSALDLDRRQHDIPGQVTRLTNIGSVEFFRGRYLEALDWYRQADQLAAGDRQLVLTNLATLYDQLGENDKALDYYQKALALGPTAELWEGIAGLHRRMGDPAKALEAYRKALALGPSSRIWEETGVTQAVDQHDLTNALSSFDEAVKTATPKEAPLAHLYRGEALYRLHRDAVADFRAAGENWLALFRLGDLAKALAIHDAPLPPGFFPPKRELYDAAIEQSGISDPNGLFPLYERAHDVPGEPATLDEVRSRLAPGTLLVEYWRRRFIWATHDRAGVGDLPMVGIHQVLVVRDTAQVPFAQLSGSFLPYGSFLVRDEPWRTSLLPWNKRGLTVTSKQALYTVEAPIVILNGKALADTDEPNRSHVVVSATESLYLGEIHKLPLGRTDIVILAAPDPTLILSRALLAAGARSVISGAPEAVQASLLAKLAHGELKIDALRETAREYPQYSSALILMGDGQQRSRDVMSSWILGAPVLIAAVSIRWWTRRRKR